MHKFDITPTTKNIIDTIQAMQSLPNDLGANSLHHKLLFFPFFDDVDRAFEELEIKAEGSYTPIGGIDSEFNICFPLDGFNWQIDGTVRYGHASIARYDKIEKGNFGYIGDDE